MSLPRFELINLLSMKRFAWGPTFVAVVGMLLPVLNGCKTSDSPAQPSATAALAGVVVDESLKPVAGATVKAGTQTTTSDSRGYFAFSAATATDGRFVVQASKDGYFTASMGIKPGATSTRTQIALTELKAAKTFTAGAAATLTDSGMKVVLPTGMTRNGTDYSGSAKAYMRYVSPRARNLSALMPGGDFVGQAASGTTQALITYGAVQMQLKDGSGQDLELKSGQTATVRFPANGATLSSIPLWHFDEAAGIWKEEGSATLQGNEYVGTVSHFSSWNLDMGTGEGGVKGFIRDCLGNPAAGVWVKIGQKSVMTDEDGSFYASAPSGAPLTVSTDWPSGNVSGQTPSIVAGSVTDVANLLGCVPSVKGRLLNCSGAPVSGTVILFSADGRILSFATASANGSFTLPGPAGASVRLLATSEQAGNTGVDTTLSMPATGQRDVGNLRLCNNTPIDTTNNPLGSGGTISFSVTDTTQTRSYSWGSVASTSAFAFWNVSNNLTAISTADVRNGASNSLVIAFPGKSTGDVAFNGSNSDASFAITFQAAGASTATVYGTDSDHRLILRVTEYGAVGGRIRGTFSGTMFKIDPANPTFIGTVQVTNGTFNIIRGRDI